MRRASCLRAMTRPQAQRAGTGGIRRFIAGLVVAADLFAVIWLFPMLQSHAVMGVYSAWQMDASVMRDCGVTVAIPRADGWYQKMLVFNADGFAVWSGIGADMSVLYSFGAFDVWTRASSLYDAGGGRYCAFYGAYVVREDGGVFGFDTDGSLNMDEVTAAVEYDYTQLVMANFGCEDPLFAVKQYAATEGAGCAGSGGWMRIDAELRLNGAAHTYRGNKPAYMQYGRPPRREVEDFAETDMAGRVYAKYFPEYGCTVMLYCLAPSWEAVEECDAAALQKTAISALQ